MSFNFCPNLSHPDNKKIIDKVGYVEFYNQYFKNKYSIPQNLELEPNIKGIAYGPKILKTLELPKVEALFKNQFLKGNTDKFYNELISLGAGKDQTEILKNWIKDNKVETIDDLKLGILSELSYSTEINITKGKKNLSWDRDRDDDFIENGDHYYYTAEDDFLIVDPGYFRNGESITEEEYNNVFQSRALRRKSQELENSDFYSNMTVPGGTNYTENEIATPQIEPSIKGHAQFSTKNGIGWFRSDEKLSVNSLKELQEEEEYQASINPNHVKGSIIFDSIESDKIRRILEVQSDLFQKGRDVEYLAHDNTNLTPKAIKHNQFLQLLNKDNNWITFFVKSIIQDSIRKGYEEIQFPTGDTASKVEGHTTLEEHKRNIERGLNISKERLEQLKSLKDTDIIKLEHDFVDPETDEYVDSAYFHQNSNGERFTFGNSLESVNKDLKDKIEYQENSVKDWQRQLDQIETEGFAKLRPIYHFYENVVQSILKKNYPIERIRDEHNNEWFKIKLDSNSNNQIFYDLNPKSNFSVMDKLFVDLDKFSDSQQREVVDSIIYTLEEGKKEGFTTVNDLFQYARDVFNNTKDYFSDLNEDGSFNSTIEKFNDIDQNWDRFKDKVLDKLKGIGVKVEKTFNLDEEGDIETSNTEDTDTPREEFDSTEANYQRGNYDDTFSQSISSKDTASAHLKLKLSLIPEVELVNGKLEPTTNFLGMGKMMDLNKVWTALQGVLTGVEASQIYPTIVELAKENPMYSTILSNIMDDPNTAIQNEFVVAFSKQQMKPVTVKIGYSDKAGRRTINIFGTNRQGANDILVTNWYNNFKNSSFVEDDGTGNLVVNPIRGKQANDAFINFMSNFDIRDINLAKNLQKGLSSIGIDLSIVTIDNLIKNGAYIGRTKFTAKEFLNRYVGLIFKKLAIDSTISNGLGDGTEEDSDSKLEFNNPFISETTALTALAKLENISNPFLYESSYIGGDGKPRYSISNNTYLSKLFNKLSDEEKGLQYVEDKLSTTYAANSIWGNKYKEDSDFRSKFTYNVLDSLGSDETNSPNKVFSRMNTKEKEFTRIGLFQNKGRDTSIFLAPIPSDKTTIPAIQAPRVKVSIDLDTYEVRNSEALNALYTPFVAEYSRILEVQSQQEDPNFKDKLIQGYHFGMGQKFLVYDFLNNNSELFDSNGKLRVIDTPTLKRIITPEIQKFASSLIKDQLKYWYKLGLLEVDKKTNDYANPLFDKSYRSKLGNFQDPKQEIRAFGADYAINQFLAHFNYTQLIGGDPALHGKKSIDATWINYTKRLAKDIAPGLDGNFTNPNFTTIFLRDLEYKSQHFNEYQEVLGERADAYKKLNPADAQEYTTLKEHLAVMKAYGKLSPLQEAAGNRLLEGGEDPFDIDLILQPMKPVYVGTIVDKSMGIDRMYYIKTSSFPLIPALTKGLEIDKLRIAMEDKGIDRAVYESGVKLGLGINNINSTESSQGVVSDNLDFSKTSVVLDRDGFRLQQENPFHDPTIHPNINEGSQGRKLILSDVNDDEVLNLFNQEISGVDAKKFYEALHIEKMDRAFNKLITDIGATNNNGKLEIKDLSKLQKILIEEATDRSYNINDVYGLQIENIDGKQRFKIPLGFNNSSNRLESILNSLFTNRVIKSELPGFSKIQGSSAGFSRLRTLDQLNSQIKDSIIWLDPKDTTLNYIRKDNILRANKDVVNPEEGKFAKDNNLLQAEILVPSWFVDNEGKSIDISQFINEEDVLDTKRLPEELLTTIGLRIPTQGYNSMMSFKVKGFLPRVVGDLAIVPAEIVAQMGSDFDVDKLYMYRYHYNYDSNTKSLSKIQSKYEPKKLDKYTDEEIDNSIIQYYEDRYKDPKLLSKILEPNGFGDLPELAKSISKALGTNRIGNFFTTEAQNTIHKNNADGKAGTGIFSLFSTFIKAAQDAKLKLPNSISFKVDDRIVRSNTLYGEGFTKTPSTVVMYLQSASVDNAKEQILGALNINSQTMDVAGTIALAGFDENYIAYFLSQPIIREYVDLLANTNDITNPVYKSNALKEQEVLAKLFNKYKVEDTESLGVETIFSLDDMKSELSNPSNLNQRKLLTQFLDIKESAKDIRLVQNAINTDTNGLGIRYVDLQVKQNNINIVRSGESNVLNSEKLFNNSQIGKASEVLEKALDLFSNILPYDTQAYKYTSTKVLQEMGKADVEINSKDLKSIYDSIKSFIYTNNKLLNISDIDAERNRLLYGTLALGNRWEAYTKTPAGKKNILSERILVRRGNTINDPIRLEALNTPAANSSDTNDSMAALYRMYYKGSTEEKALVKDLINYFVLTGAKQGPNSIAKYIPYDLLEESDFSSKLNDIDKDLREDTNNILESSIEQYFQHNPSKAIAFDSKSKDIHSYTRNGFSMSPDSQYLISDGKGNLVAPTYMSMYDRGLKSFVLYKLADGNPLGYSYSRIDLLGTRGIDEYNFNSSEQYSLFKSNQSNLEIPATPKNRIVDAKDSLTEGRPEGEAIIDKDYLINYFNLDNGNIESSLNKIIESNNEYSNMASDLKRVLVSYPNIKLDTNESGESIRGIYNTSTDTISLNLDNLLTSKNPVESTTITLLHELLHAITANKIENYNNLSEQDKKSVDKLKVLLNQYKRIVDQDELSKFNTITQNLREGVEVSNEDKQWYLENKSQYYPLSNLHEFIAAGLTDKVFTQKLKDNNFWSKLWEAISNLLGLNKEFSNDYDALYKTTLDLGSNVKEEDEEYKRIEKDIQDWIDKGRPSNPLEDLNPRDAKQEFLTKYHLYDGKPMTAPQFDRINNSVKANDKYKNIKLDLVWENGQRVLRVFTKSSTPLYDINPNTVKKTAEEKYIDLTLSRLRKLRNKLKKSVDYSNNVSLQSKVEDINNRIKAIMEGNTLSVILSDIKDRLSIIEERIGQDTIMNTYDTQESKDYLTFYKDIRKYVNYNEAFEQENRNLDLIVRKAESLLAQVRLKEKELLKSFIRSRIKLKVDLDNLLESPQFDAGVLESYLQSGTFSSNQIIQLTQKLIDDAQMRANEDFNEQEESIKSLVEEFLKEYKNYDILLQKDKNGNNTGGLLNKYSNEYYDELKRLKSLKDKKAWNKFYRENTEVGITERGKKEFEKDLNEVKDLYPLWEQEGTHDNAYYTQWLAAHDPYAYLSDYKKGIYRNKSIVDKYISQIPIDKWIDPNYSKLKALPEDNSARKLYDLLDTEFRQLARKYGNQANYIPELSKDLVSYMLKGNIKGGFDKIKSSIVDSIFSTIEPKFSSADTDINGVPHDIIPVYMMDGTLDPTKKSYDLGRILMTAKAQEATLKHKSVVEPYLIILKELTQDLPEYATNQAGEVLIGDDGNPIVDTSPSRNSNLNDQQRWMMEDYLYNRGTKNSNYSKTTIKQKSTNLKGEQIETTKVLTGSKIADTISNFTRIKGMGLNVFSGVGNVYYGLLSNAVASGDRKSFGEKESIQALGIMLNSVIPGTATRTKVNKLMKYFDVLVQTNEIKYGQFDLKSPENPLKNLSVYEFQKRGEYFVQGQTAMAMLLTRKVKDLEGKEYRLYDAFDDNGKWNTTKFGENPYDNRETYRELYSDIRNTISSIHGDYARGLRAKEKWLGRALLVFRTWLPQSIAVRWGKEYTDLEGNVEKGRYRSYKLEHALVLPFIRDAYKAFTIAKEDDTIDTRNIRKNAIELTFIPILWAVALMLKSMLKSGNDDDDKALLTFILNSTTRAQGDLTFFFNPYAFHSTIQEPIPAFKTLMDVMDIGPAVLTTLEGNGTYKTGVHKGQSKIGVKARKAVPLLNQPDKLIQATETILGTNITTN